MSGGWGYYMCYDCSFVTAHSGTADDHEVRTGHEMYEDEPWEYIP